MAAPIYYTAEMVRALPDPDAQRPAVERVGLHWLPTGDAQPFELFLPDLFGEA